jgi:hypothetical protein
MGLRVLRGKKAQREGAETQGELEGDWRGGTAPVFRLMIQFKPGGTQMPAPEIIRQLVERYRDNYSAYHSPAYNETQARREFIDPLFKALEWDMDNEQGYAEAYKDVIHEDAIKVGGATKAPDYAFRIGGTRKFFVEAKKPSVNIKGDISPAFQLRRYAWSSKLPLSILTDFEEFAIYDCRDKPDKSDKASTGRTHFFTFEQYPEKWDEIAAIFSKQAVLKGSFDRYAEGAKGKHGTADVDDAFLIEISRWRDLLAHNLALRNPNLSQRELNYSVQMTIDRIIFLRICEDRGIEPYGRLQGMTKGAIYTLLLDAFRSADQRYNSGLFHFQKEKGRGAPDDLTPYLLVDDKPLRDIIQNLYYPDSPYEFSVLPVEILGQVYEQFLGKVIRLTPGHHAVVEDKPEVKKAGGVFYTPTYIVEYIVRHTLGAQLEGQKPGIHPPLRVLDPACGSGSFLLGAYQYLLDWHRDGYLTAGAEKWAKGKNPRLYQAQGGEWKLTTNERKRILLSHIYGVDIDPQAVEVTKLSLLLKVLEGESQGTISGQMALLQERVLPDLSKNIKCGNSLIGSDFYSNQQASFLDAEEQYRINAFDWEREFADAFQEGGFDVVIGNPPYVRQEGLGEFKPYFQRKYQAYHGIADLYTYFFERGISLLKPGGIFGFIVANKWLRGNFGEPLRRWLKQLNILEITDFGDLPVFQDVTTYPCIIRIVKEEARHETWATQVNTLDFQDLDEYIRANQYLLDQMRLDDKGWSLDNEQGQVLIEKIKSCGVPIEEYTQRSIYRGVITGLNDAFVIDSETRQRLITEDTNSTELIKPFLLGRDIKRYKQPESNQFLIMMPRGWTRQQSNNAKDAWGWFKKHYPAIAGHLEPYAAAAEKRYDKGEYWWELRACDYYPEFEKVKIIYPNICKRPEFGFDARCQYSNQKCYIIPKDDKYIIGILNSSLSMFLFSKILPKLRGDFYEPSFVYFKDFPIRPIDFNDTADTARHERMVSLVERMLGLHEQLGRVKTPNERAMLERQIEAVDGQIDGLVYELYGLSEEEVRVVEGK